MRGGKPSEKGTEKGKTVENGKAVDVETCGVGHYREWPIGSASRRASATGEEDLLESTPTGVINAIDQPVKWEMHQEVVVRTSVTNGRSSER